MVVTKILETTLAAGVTSVQFTDSDIPNSLIRVFCNDADLIYTSLSLTGNTLTVTYPAQNVNKSIALELVKAGLDIVDNLSTDDATKALSAKQGKALDDKIDELDMEDLYNVSVTEAENGDILIYYGGEWINVPGKNNITDMDDVAVSTIQDGQVLAWDDNESKFVNVNPAASSYPYMDGTNEIYNSGMISSNFSNYSYTPTVDCWIVVTTKGTGGTSLVYLNGGIMCGNAASTEVTFTPFLIKSGDTITLRDLTGAVYVIRAYGTR